MSSPQETPPELLGRWGIEGRAGAGATAVVHRARHADTGVVAAVKVLAEGAALGEIDVLARAARRWGPRLLDLGRTGDGRPYVATEWTDGEPIAPGGVAASERPHLAAIVAHGVARGLAELHAMGVRHGDVKPANVIAGKHVPTRDAAADRGATLIDLGLAARVGEPARGGTPRYAAPELRRGDEAVGPQADLWALGVLLAELVWPEVATAEQPADAARRATGGGEPGVWARALLADAAGARPSAEWIAERAARYLRLAVDGEEEAEARAADVRRAYLAVRAAEIDGAAAVSEAVKGAAREWLEDALRWGARTDALAGSPRPRRGVLGPSSRLVRALWLVRLAGPAAATWPVGDLGAEDALAERLVSLARRLPPWAWTPADVRNDVPSTEAQAVVVPTEPAERAAWLVRALGAPYPPPQVVAAAEADVASGTAPSTVVRALGDALLRGGEPARAFLALSHDRSPDARARCGEAARRTGDAATARACAEEVLAAPSSMEARDLACATLARLAWDTGDLDAAEAYAARGRGPAAAEARALVAYARGAAERGLAELRGAVPLAAEPLAFARLEAARGMLEHAVGRPERALDAFARAADLAARLGATPEEAACRVGEATAALEAGDIAGAIASGQRAALLLERLGRSGDAARAHLARAAALATVGARHEADEAAARARALARGAGDHRAAAYARWARVETRAYGDDVAREEALLADAELGPSASADDRVRSAARVLAWAPDAMSAERLDAVDAEARSAHAAARWEWWGARAQAELAGRAGSRGALSELVALAEVPAPIGSRGPALAAGVALARARGEGDVARRFETLRRSLAARLRASTPPELAGALAEVPWTRDTPEEATPDLAPEQIAQLETLVRSLQGRERLRPLLEQVLDAMVLWTGVERGLLLLRAPPLPGAPGEVRLLPRAARNLAREDLHGEQLALSRTIAARAMATGEPVVATDAFAAMGDVHASVHALRLRSVLAVPLVARGETLGVVYLDDRARRGAFGPRELAWVRLVAGQAAMAIADARDQVQLRRAARRAERARARVAALLEQREAELDETRTALAHARADGETRHRYDAIAGRSEAMRSLLRVVDRVTESEVPVLIVGESGTGKELVARAIHENGPRKRRAFVSENCASVPESLLESTLFGHVKGAFTGASSSRAGLFEVADGGTLFLDEIGEMPLTMQSKLLRVLQDGEVRPVGSERTRRVDVRLVAATHRDLEAMVRAGTFRQDLFYRIGVVTLSVPPLRERPDDVPLIVQHLLAKHAAGKRLRVTRAAMDRLVAFPWPGNVRQLENEIRRAVVLAEGGEIDVSDLSPDVARGGPGAPRGSGLDLRTRVDALERELLTEALSRTRGNQTRAAELLGLSRFGLQKMMKRLGLSA
jgi:transcriptional regulator with GAF, ATPase, and Fis domain